MNWHQSARPRAKPSPASPSSRSRRSKSRRCFFLGTADELSGDLATAYARYEESLQLFRQHGDAMYCLLMLSILAVLVSSQGDEEAARSLYDQILPLLHRPRSRWELGMFLITNGDYRLHLFGHDQQAKVLYKEGLSLWQDIQHVGDGIGIVKALSTSH